MGTTAEKLQAILDSKADIKDAIEAKGVTVGDATLAEYAGKIGEIQQGGGSVPSMDDEVLFIDYDGTILHSYSATDFALVDTLPNNPTHEGLTSQGWNWALADAKSYVQSYGRLVIGQNYITSDGITRLYIRIQNTERLNTIIYFGQDTSNGVSVNWGDGSAEETVAGTGNKNISHTYATTGYYTIQLKPSSGVVFYLGNKNSGRGVMGAGNAAECWNSALLIKAEIGTHANELYDGTFLYCRYMESVVIPSNITKIGWSAFHTCNNIKGCVVPSGCTYINTYGFANCNQLLFCSMPKSITSFSSYVFSYSTSLYSCNIPPEVTVLGNNFFDNCRGLKHLTFPNGIISLGNNAIGSCMSLISPLRFNSVTTAGNSAFMSCYDTPIIELNSLSGTLAQNLIRSCMTITKFTIPSGVTAIGENSFLGNYGIKELYVLPETPPTLESSALQATASDLVIYVPHGKLSAYQTATNWINYADKMVEL